MSENEKIPRRFGWPELYIGAHLAAGTAVMLAVFARWDIPDKRHFLAYLLTAMVASTMKVHVPRVRGTITVGFLFQLIGILDLTAAQAVAISLAAITVQVLWKSSVPPKAIRVLFCLASSVTGTYVSTVICQGSRRFLPDFATVPLVAVALFAATMLSWAGVVAVVEGGRFLHLLTVHRWLLPYYLCGASLAWLIGTMPAAIQWEVPIICLPLVYAIHHSNAKHLVQIEQQKKHAEEMTSLHLRTVETLAAAIDARDHETREHLSRVQLYAVAIGRELGLDEAHLDALAAASLLHDIGKLAVPERILNKPGRLTREEFDQMKVHPVVGAEILERVGFPYPVAPTVRAHHEKWNGQGYPDGLRGEEIPLGARILSAVDCLDALASDRQYRLALSLDDAMAKVASEAGTSFDPAVVAVLARRYRELEALADAAARGRGPAVSRNLHFAGGAPAAGFAEASLSADLRQLVLHTQNEPSGEPMEQFAASLDVAIAHDGMALFVLQDGHFRAQYAAGAAAPVLRKLAVPYGAGLIGWVAENRTPLINGNPEVEPGWPRRTAPLVRSALVLPLDGPAARPAVLALYRAEAEAFENRDVSALLDACRAMRSV